MEQNQNGGASRAFAIIIAVLVIVGVGYFMRPQPIQESQTISEGYSTATTTQQPVVSSSATSTPASTNTTIKNNMNTVTIETNKGVIVIETYDADAPKAAGNFVTLANKGFYNGVIFHRVISGFMIQGGDPTGTGRGGPGYAFADELDPNTPSAKEGYRRGVVAMANSGPNTNGSQFFIMHADYPLPHKYTIFGKVVKGMEIVDAIASSPVDGDDRPLEKIVMNKVTVTPKQ